MVAVQYMKQQQVSSTSNHGRPSQKKRVGKYRTTQHRTESLFDRAASTCFDLLPLLVHDSLCANTTRSVKHTSTSDSLKTAVGCAYDCRQ